MKPLLFSSLMLVTLLIVGEDLTTKSGKVYENYSITGVTHSGVTVEFANGITSVPLSELPDDLREKYASEVEDKKAVVMDLQKIHYRGEYITVRGKNKKKYEKCRIQRIGASGLTLKIGGTSVYIPFRLIRNFVDGTLVAPSFAPVLQKTQTESSREENETSSTQQNLLSSQKTSTVNTMHTGPRGGIYYYNSKGRKTYARKRR